MNALQQLIIDKLKLSWLYAAVLGVTLLFFIYRGILYSMIGSYVPILLILTIIVLFLFSTYRSQKAFIRILGLWSILVMLWAGVRLLLGIVNQFAKPIPEGHVAGQLGIVGILFSVAFLFCGVYLWKFKKRVFNSAIG